MTQRAPTAARAKRGRGRPTRLTRELADAFLRDVAAGLPISCAAELRGLSKSLVLGWVRRGEARDLRPVASVYRRFARRYHQAGAVFMRACLRVVHEALLGPPSADRHRLVWWLLERRFPEYWGPHLERPRRAADKVHVATSPATDVGAYEAVARNFGSVGPAPSDG